jgi:hypothetical protein
VGTTTVNSSHPHGDPRQAHRVRLLVEHGRVAELGGGDGVAGHHLEEQPDPQDAGQRHARVPGGEGDHQRTGDAGHGRAPSGDVGEEAESRLGKEQRGQHSGHEEDEGVQQRQDPQALGGLPHQVRRQAPRSLAGRARRPGAPA